MEFIGSFRSLVKSDFGSLEYSQLISEIADIAESNFFFAMVGVIFMFVFLLVVSVAVTTFLTTRAFFDRAPPKGGPIRRSKKAAHFAAHVNIPIVTFF